jgi:hypothetical protein
MCWPQGEGAIRAAIVLYMHVPFSDLVIVSNCMLFCTDFIWLIKLFIL